jgi:transposase
MERKQFDREFKAQAVRLCEQEDVPIAQVARELGINVKLLYRWRTEAQQAGAAAFPGQGHSSDDEVRRLRRELAQQALQTDLSPPPGVTRSRDELLTNLEYSQLLMALRPPDGAAHLSQLFAHYQAAAPTAQRRKGKLVGSFPAGTAPLVQQLATLDL